MSHEQLTLQEIVRTGAIMKGHFVGTSGEHMPQYVAKEKILIHPKLVAKITRTMASLARQKQPEVVIGPAVGGAVLAQSVARELSRGKSKAVLAAFTEKVESETGEVQTLKREFNKLVKGRVVLVIDDTVNTAKSIGEAVDAVRKAGGVVALALTILNRNETDEEISAKIRAPYRSLFTVPMKSYKVEEAPAELMRIPVNKTYGHGAAYLKTKKNEHAVV